MLTLLEHFKMKLTLFSNHSIFSKIKRINGNSSEAAQAAAVHVQKQAHYVQEQVEEVQGKLPERQLH